MKYSKHLQTAGLSRDQADAQAEALSEAISESVATRAQLESVELKLTNRIDGLDAQINSIRWMIGLLIGMVTVILVKLLVM
ncbi:MAG: hypothetical protein L0H73_10140 [Nitrococcus sp.]|nr:hypothetical protein [Nitrococcus sp.]